MRAQLLVILFGVALLHSATGLQPQDEQQNDEGTLEPRGFWYRSWILRIVCRRISRFLNNPATNTTGSEFIVSVLRAVCNLNRSGLEWSSLMSGPELPLTEELHSGQMPDALLRFLRDMKYEDANKLSPKDTLPIDPRAAMSSDDNDPLLRIHSR